MISLGERKVRMCTRISCGKSLQKLKFGRRGKGFSEISGKGFDRGLEGRMSIGTETVVISLRSKGRNREFASK